MIKDDGEAKSFGDMGFGGKAVYTIGDKHFAAVVSNSPLREYEATETEVEVHKRVVAEVMKKHSVLPVAYSMVFKNEKILLLTMHKARKAMKKAIRVVENKLELGLKVILSNNNLMDKEEYIKKFKTEFDKIAKIADESKKIRLFSQLLALNAAFLVDRGKVEEFSSQVGRLKDAYPSLKIQYTGPWAPHNFVDIRILGRQQGGFR